MNLRRRFAAVLLLSWPAMAVLAEPVGLFELYQTAKLEDPDFAGAVATYQAGLKNREIGLASLLPTLSASVANTQNRYGLATTASAWKDYKFVSHVKTIQLTQMIFDWEKISAYSESAARADYAEAAFTEAKADLILRTAQAYFNYLLAEDSLELADAQRKALGEQQVQSEKLYRAGVGTVTDMEETLARHEVAEAQYLVAASTLDSRRRELEKMVTVVPEVIRRLDGPIELALPEPREITPWLAAATRQNPKVISMQWGVKIAEAQVERARAGHLPTVNLVASQQKGDAPSYSTLSDDDKRIGVQLSIPLFSGGKVTATQDQAVQQREKAIKDLESVTRDSRIKAGQAYLGVVNGVAQVRALEQAVKSSATALKGMEIGQRTGFRTNTDVLNAQQQLFANKRDLQLQRYTYLLSRLQLQAVVGTLNDDDVLLIDAVVAKRK
jgi:TolC family type I secretion outer membrane protein